MGARLLRLCPISAGHGPAIPASTQGVPAVSISSKPIAADAIECRNHAASQTSRTVNAARYAHIADSVLEVCLSATPMYGVHIGDSGAKPLPARKGLTGLRLCVTGRNSEPATSAICPRIPVFGAARCADRTCTAADGRREERTQTGSLVARRSPRPGASRSSRSRPASISGRLGADHRGKWRGGPACPRQASWRPAAR